MSEANPSSAPAPVASDQRLETESLWQNPLVPELRAPQPASSNLSEERLDSLASISESLHRTTPEFAGMTVFGSTARGEAGAESDVDLFVFIKPSKAPESPQMNPRIPADQPKITRTAGEVEDSYLFHTAIAIDYKATILKALKAASIPSADLDILPIDEAIIDESTETLLKSAEGFDGDTAHVTIPRNIRGLFHKSVDTDQLQPYIQRVVDGLAASEFGDLAWLLLAQRVAWFENGRDAKQFDYSSHREIPKTLADAQAYYGLATQP